MTTESRILGEYRRKLVKERIRSAGPVDPRLLKPKLQEDELGSLQRVHPALCGGEDLPELGEDEVEIVRISFPTNIHGEVTSIRVHREGGENVFRICDEYESTFSFEPGRSARPLTMGEVISLIDTAEDGDSPPGIGGLVARWGWRSSEAGVEPEDMVDDVVVTSEFYPELGEFYEWRFWQWCREQVERKS